MNQQVELFSNKALKEMIVPLFLEQLLVMLVGLASGGAVVISQYIGRKAMDAAGESASQLLLFSVIFSALVSALVLFGSSAAEWKLIGRISEKWVKDLNL